MEEKTIARQININPIRRNDPNIRYLIILSYPVLLKDSREERDPFHVLLLSPLTV